LPHNFINKQHNFKTTAHPQDTLDGYDRLSNYTPPSPTHYQSSGLQRYGGQRLYTGESSSASASNLQRNHSQTHNFTTNSSNNISSNNISRAHSPGGHSPGGGRYGFGGGSSEFGFGSEEESGAEASRRKLKNALHSRYKGDPDGELSMVRVRVYVCVFECECECMCVCV
jgi:hypothetical protein